MKRCPAGIAVLCAVCVAAQSRDSYREAYRVWRQADVSLERDAAAGGAAVAQRADAVAAKAAQYGAARGEYWKAVQLDLDRSREALVRLTPPERPDLAPARDLTPVITAEMGNLTRSVGIFENDPDPGIQQLRESMLRERAALEGINTAIANRRKAEEKTAEADAAAERARQKALDAQGELRAAVQQSAAQFEKESRSWAEYYQKLAVGVQAGVQPGVQGPAATAPPPLTSSVKLPANAPRPLNTSPAAVPLVRFVGGWIYPPQGGVFHGAQPEFVDLVVHEDKGQATGTLFARFKVPAGAGLDPELRFDLSGPFKSTRSQTFAVETSDGGKGTIELIPGPAFNLLEVNFSIESKAGKVRQGNVLLVKK